LYSHPDVNALSVGQTEQEITRGEATFAPLLKNVGCSPQFIRFPYNHTGDTKEKHDAVAAFLSERGYRLAPCTIDNTDYEFNVTYVLALSRYDEQAAPKVRADYIAYTGAEIDWYTALNKQVFGYEPQHIMLFHDNPLNADKIEAVLGSLSNEGTDLYRWHKSSERSRISCSGDLYHQVRSHVGISLGAGKTSEG
jgi:hypothetical protein